MVLLGINLRLWIGEPQQTVAGLGTGGDLDLALIFQVGPGGLSWPASLERTWLGDDQFRVVIPASWPIAEDSQLTVDQLAEWPWIFHHPGTSDATLISRLFASYNIHPQVSAYCDDFNASLSLVSSRVWEPHCPRSATWPTLRKASALWMHQRSAWPAPSSR